MTDLRKQLDAAKREYRLKRYPGDLVSELMEASAPVYPPLKYFLGAGSVAAGVLIAFFLSSRPHSKMPIIPRSNPEVAIVSPTTQLADEDDDLTPVTELASVPAFPDSVSVTTPTTMASTSAESEYLPMAPSVPSMELGSMPSLPSLDFSGISDIESTQQTSKEST